MRAMPKKMDDGWRWTLAKWANNFLVWEMFSSCTVIPSPQWSYVPYNINGTWHIITSINFVPFRKGVFEDFLKSGFLLEVQFILPESKPSTKMLGRKLPASAQSKITIFFSFSKVIRCIPGLLCRMWSVDVSTIVALISQTRTACTKYPW